MTVPQEYLRQLQAINPKATDKDYMAVAQKLVDSGVKLPNTVEELHQLILLTAKTELKQEPKFEPLIDLGEYQHEQELTGTARELASTKVETLAEVYEQTYLEDFDKWLEERSPLLTTKDESLQKMTLKLLHELKTEKNKNATTHRQAVLAVIQNTLRYWVVGGVFGVFLSVYAQLSIMNAIAYSGAISGVISPVVVLFDRRREE